MERGEAADLERAGKCFGEAMRVLTEIEDRHLSVKLFHVANFIMVRALYLNSNGLGDWFSQSWRHQTERNLFSSRKHLHCH